MDERSANIDVLFRNGLKDHELLPPPEVWDNIRPVIRNGHRPVIFLRAAAMITVVMTLSFLAYRFGRQISSDIPESRMALNPESELTITGVPVNTVPGMLPSSDGRIYLSDALIKETNNREQVVRIPEDRQSQAIPEPVTEVSGISGIKPAGETGIIHRSIRVKESLDINQPVDQQMTASGEVHKRWSIAALVSPTYYKSFLSGANAMAEEMMADEQSRMSYSGGLALSYNINRRFTIQSGLYYTSIGQEINGISSYGGFRSYDYTKGDRNFEVLTSTGTVYTSNADVFLTDPSSPDRVITRYTNDVFDPTKAELSYIDNSLRQDFSYLELPVVLRYKIIDKSIDFDIIGGFSSNLLVANSVYATVNSNKYPIGKTEGLNTIAFSSSLGMGMEYSFSKNISFNVEPTLRYYINPFNQIPGMRIHPYSFGVFSGLSYKF